MVPATLNNEWNLITRAIVPIIDQTDVAPGLGRQRGLGDTVASLFFSPKAPTAGGWIWDVGPVLLLPTGRDGLTVDRWGLGPGGVHRLAGADYRRAGGADQRWAARVSVTFLFPR